MCIIIHKLGCLLIVKFFELHIDQLSRKTSNLEELALETLKSIVSTSDLDEVTFAAIAHQLIQVASDLYLNALVAAKSYQRA